MRLPFSWLFPAVAIAASGLALGAGRDLSIALPAAVLAVVAGALTIVEVLVQGSPPRARRESTVPNPRASVHAAFRSGRYGREELLTTLDKLERAGPHPDLPSRPAGEIDRLTRLPAAEFRQYVADRLHALEVAE
jgi:hypothetical protein